MERRRRALLYNGIKAVHSLIFLTLQTLIVYFVYKGLRRQSDRRAAIAGLIVGGECAIYAGNGFRCPLTGLAEDLGAEHGAVTDIFLPRWLAANIANIYGPLFVLGVLLHALNLARIRHSGGSSRTRPASARNEGGQTSTSIRA